MLFIIAVVAAIGIAVFLGKLLKKCPIVFYLAAVLISAAVSVFSFRNVPVFVNNYIIALFSRGALATGLWAVVMWTGAFANGSKPKKTLMPIRGELSILAALLTLGHNIGFGRIYFVRMFTAPSSMSEQQLAAGIVSIIMLAIMLPLTVISFPKIRKKMKPKLWKQIQRAAYVFYALIYVHVMILSIPSAISGKSGYLLTVAAYSVVFIGYATFRIRNLIVSKRKPKTWKKLNFCTSGAAALLCAAVIFAALPRANPEVLANAAGSSDRGGDLSESTRSSQPVVSSTYSSTDKPTTDNSSSEQSVSTDSSLEIEEPPVSTAVTGSISESETPSEPEKEILSESEKEVPSEPESPPIQSTVPPAESILEETSVYLDGEYTAAAFGYDGDITVTITISGDKITDIKAYSDESDIWYFDTAADTVISRILSEQSTEVDAVTGATFSSKGIMAAVADALESAKRR